MKKNIVLIIFFASFLFAIPNYAQVSTYANQEEQHDQLWQTANPEPGPSNLPGDPGIPEVPIDTNLYFLLAAALLYALILFRKEKRLKI